VKIIFVDGYNVINSWPNLKELKEYSFEGSRKKLEEILQNYTEFKGCRLYLVYDAHHVSKNQGNHEKIGEFNIIFTKENETADSYIEKAVDLIGRKADISVVTSDSLEQQVTFQRGATRISSLEFYYEIIEIDKIIKNTTKKKYSDNRNVLQDRIDNNILEKLEKIRRNR
jgi:predicted RNA-binding protein with PIN domain